MADKKLVILKESLDTLRNAHVAGIAEINGLIPQAEDAISEALTQTDINPDFISYVVGTLPDATGATEGTIGAYFTDSGLLQKVEWSGSEWVDIGEPISTKKYVDNKASLLRDEIGEEVSTEKITVKGSKQSEALSANGALRLDGNRKKGAVFTFTDDDGERSVYDTTLPIFKARGAVGNLALNPDRHFPTPHTGRLTPAEILEFYNDEGWEIVNHGIDHKNLVTVLDTDGEAACRAVITDAIDIFEANNIPVPNFCYTFGSENKAVRDIVRDYHRCSLGSLSFPGRFDTYNRQPYETYRLNRFGFDGSVDSSDGVANPDKNYAHWKAIIDEAVEQGHYVEFMMHSRFTANFEEVFADKDGVLVDFFTIKGQVIDYIQSLGLPILRLNDLMDQYGNLVDISDSFGNWFAVSATGKVSQENKTDAHTTFGKRAGNRSKSSESTLFGRAAGERAEDSVTDTNPIRKHLTAIGELAGEQNKGSALAALGRRSGSGNEGDRCAFLGSFAGQNNKAHELTSVGYRAGVGNEGAECAFFGYEVGALNVGSDKSLFGWFAGSGGEAENRLTFFGCRAGQNNTASSVTAVGRWAARNNSGAASLGVGQSAIRFNEGLGVMAFGTGACENNTGGFVNAFGESAGKDNQGENCLFFGRQAGMGNLKNNWIEIKHESASSKAFIKGSLATGAICLGAPTQAVPGISDADVENNRFFFFLNTAEDKLMIKLRDSSGVLKSGEITLI